MVGPRTTGITLLAVLALALSPPPTIGRTGQDQPQAHTKANKMHPNVPDIAIWEVQFLGRTGSDPKGDIGPELVRVKIKNWTTDRTITGVLWEISVYDVDKQKVVEVLTPYTYRDTISPEITLKVAPGYLIEVPFYVNRQVHIDGNHTAQVKIKNYAYKKFDAAAGDKKPGNLSYLVGEEWPFKTNTEPVLIEEKR
jgi:hypothetical protein